MELYEKLLIFTFIKQLFPAFNAGLHVTSSVEPKGFAVVFGGFNEKIQLLVEMTSKVLKRLPEDVNEDIFELQKAEMKKDLMNSALSPRSIQFDLLSKSLKNEYWTDFDKYNEIDKISFETLQKFLEKFYRKTKIQVLIQGNILKTQTDEIVKILEMELTNEPLETVRLCTLS